MLDLATTFAGHRLDEVIGRDAVSTSYRATSVGRPGETVMLQVSEPLGDGRERRRATLFKRKATAAMDVKHPGIARVLQAGVTDDRAYVVTAWRPSTTLDQLIARRWRLPAHEAVPLLLPAADGLDRAHTAGIVHAALGTRSIRVTTDAQPQAYVTGFGFDALLALRMGSKADRDATPVLDDLLYVAPEQLRGGRIEPATDQYGLACALYHCLTGEPPFVRDTTSALFGAHLFARPPVSDVLQEPAVAPARAALVTGLDKVAEERHASCTALIRAAEVRGAQAAAARSPAPPAAATAAPPTKATATGTTATTPPTDARDDHGRTAAFAHLLRGLPVAVWITVAAVLGIATVVALIGATRSLTSADATAAGPRDGVAREGAAPRSGEDGAGAGDAAGGDGDLAAGGDTVAGEDATRTARVAWQRAAVATPVTDVTAAGGVVAVISDRELVAIDPSDGEVRWRRASDGGAVSDATVTDEAVVFRSPSGLTALALDDGRELWSRNDRYTPTGGLTAAAPDGLYGMGPGRILPELMAMDPAVGEETWHFHGEDVTVKQHAAIAADDRLVAMLQDGALYGLDPEAELGSSGAGRLEIEDPEFLVQVGRPWRATLTLVDDAVLFARRNGAVCSIDRADGSRRWCRRVDGVGAARPRLLVDGDLVVVATRATAAALDRATGRPRWAVPVGSRISAAAIDAEQVVMAGRDGTVLGLDRVGGAERWRTAQDTTVTALELVDGAAVAGMRDGGVLRLVNGDTSS